MIHVWETKGLGLRPVPGQGEPPTQPLSPYHQWRRLARAHPAQAGACHASKLQRLLRKRHQNDHAPSWRRTLLHPEHFPRRAGGALPGRQGVCPVLATNDQLEALDFAAARGPADLRHATRRLKSARSSRYDWRFAAERPQSWKTMQSRGTPHLVHGGLPGPVAPIRPSSGPNQRLAPKYEQPKHRDQSVALSWRAPQAHRHEPLPRMLAAAAPLPTGLDVLGQTPCLTASGAHRASQTVP